MLSCGCVGLQEEERRGEEKDERKRKYNVTHNDEVGCLGGRSMVGAADRDRVKKLGGAASEARVGLERLERLEWWAVSMVAHSSHGVQVTAEEMEAYRMKKVAWDDPMRDFV